jgi:hypothetical protein
LIARPDSSFFSFLPGNFWEIGISRQGKRLFALSDQPHPNLEFDLGCQWLAAYLATNIHVPEEDKHFCSD